MGDKLEIIINDESLNSSLELLYNKGIYHQMLLDHILEKTNEFMDIIDNIYLENDIYLKHHNIMYRIDPIGLILYIINSEDISIDIKDTCLVSISKTISEEDYDALFSGKYNTTINNKQYQFNLIEIANLFNLSNSPKQNKIIKIKLSHQDANESKQAIWNLSTKIFNVSVNKSKLLSQLREETIHDNNYLNKIKLNENFVHEVIKNIPSNYGKLKSSIYIYKKLCLILNYNIDTHIFRNDISYSEDIENLSIYPEISLGNPNVNCYNFAIIYAKLLETIGVDSTLQGLTFDNSYEEHTYLSYYVEGIGIVVDPIDNIYYGDLVNQKINREITGLEYEEEYDYLENLFIEKLTEVTSDFNKIEKVYLDFNNYIKKYINKNSTPEDIIELFTNYDFNGLTFLSIFKILFFCVDNKKMRFNSVYTTTQSGVIISYNKSDLSNIENTTYTILFDNGSFIKCNQNYLEQLLDNEYIIKLNHKNTIPGIEKQKELKRA